MQGYDIPVISSRAGGRKFQKKKETIGRSDALLIFAPRTRVLHLSAISLNARIPPIKLESLLLCTNYFSLEIYSSQHFSLGISTSEYFSLEISSEEETNPKLTLFS